MQKEIQNKLVEFLKISGVKQTFISEQTGIPVDILSRFKNGKKELFNSHLIKLKLYLEGK